LNSLMMLWKKVADESATRCCTSATRDLTTVSGRVKHEGLSFLTITLPSFGKDFEKSLDLGYVDPHLFKSFKRRGRSPVFLSGFLDLVFDRSDGRLLDEPNEDAILAIRQLTLMFGKVRIPCSDARTAAAFEQFIQCEKDIRENDARLTEEHFSDFKRVSRLLFGDMFDFMDHQIWEVAHKPKHGPGATADKLRGNAKYTQRTWTSRLQEFFPWEEFLAANSSYTDELNDVNVLEPGDEMPVRVISVPKTLKTPRIIAIEPTAMQYCQQSVREMIYDWVKRDGTLHSMIGFTDQTPNQRLAQRGSLRGDLATLDLSEASDRVSNQSVRAMLSDWPFLHGAVDACRSRKADVPGHGVVRLAKFASMGSALTFPVEAMVFLTNVFMGIEQELNRPLRRGDIQRFRGRVRVYGDDIIVPKDFVRSVIGVLELFGARVNTSKSFWNGNFRESCGREYYAGHDVSIVRVREVFPTSPMHAQEAISLVSLRNQLYYAGWWATCKWLDDEITGVLRYFPVVLPSSPVQGRYSYLGYQSEKLGRALHNPLVKGYVVRAPLPSDPLDGHGALLKWFLKRGELPFADRDHLERAGRPRAVSIVPRYASAV